MDILSNKHVKAELDNLQLQFGNKSMLNLDDYSELFRTSRRNAGRHAHRREVPFVRVGKDLFFPIIDMALYLARQKAKSEGRLIISPSSPDGMKSRRGFSKIAQEKQLLSV